MKLRSKNNNNNFKIAEDLDLYDLALIINKKKWIVIFFVIFSLIVVSIYHKNLKSSQIVKTNISSISKIEKIKYSDYNLYSFALKSDLSNTLSLIRNNVSMSLKDYDSMNSKVFLDPFPDFYDEKKLNELFLKKISDKKFLENVAIKFNSSLKIDRKNNLDYRNEIMKILLSIVITETENSNFISSKLSFDLISKNLYQELLIFLEKEINSEIQKEIVISFNRNLEVLKNIIDYEVDNINNKINNVQEIYNELINNRLYFLNEQLELAKNLGIKENNSSIFQLPYFDIETGIIKNSNYLSSQNYIATYYLVGSDIIENEIEIYENRKNKKFYNFELIELEKLSKDINFDKKFYKLQKLFNNTPISNTKDRFVASEILVDTTNYEDLNPQLSSMLIVGAIVSLIFAVLFVLVLNSIQNRRKLN